MVKFNISETADITVFHKESKEVLLETEVGILDSKKESENKGGYKLKVYLVKRDNVSAYDDYYSSIVSVHSSFRKASQSLIDDNYKPYLSRNIYGQEELCFYWEDDDEFAAENSYGQILEMEIKD